MRVTKNIREYIEKEVRIRIENRYAEEKAEAKRQKDLLSEFLEGASAAAEAAYIAYCTEHFANISEFAALDVESEYSRPHFYSSRTATIKDMHYTSSVHNWNQRLNTEVKDIVTDIVVTLELGGTRKELDEMLANL